jgi:predicted PurR-regulated permease PerM
MLKSDALFNDRLRQVLMVLLILALLVLFLSQLYFLFPGFLGAITLFILSRNNYKKLVQDRKWKRGRAALLFLSLFTICIGLPLYFSMMLLVPRLKQMLGNKDALTKKAEAMSAKIEQFAGVKVLTPESTKSLVTKAGDMMPELLSNTAIVIGNFILILFLAYFMLTCMERMEKAVKGYIPLKKSNINLLGEETYLMVRSNAIGIPLIALIQGSFATLGYWIFGVENFVLWGFITGIFSFFPVVGTSLIWLPLSIVHFSSHPGWQSVGLLLYSVIVIGNVDYLARISILKRIGDVHPVVTILGVVLGLKLFGFWGFIFGPLLISYMLLMLRIYTSEFGTMDPEDPAIKVAHQPKPSDPDTKSVVKR